MDILIWLIIGLFVLFLLFATAEAASQLLNTPRLQLILDTYRQRSLIAARLLPQESGALRSSLSYGRMLCVAAIAAAVTVLFISRPLLGSAVGAGALLLGVFLPTLLAVARPRLTLAILLPLVRFGYILLLPLTWPRRVLFKRYKSKLRLRNGEAENTEEEAQQIEAYLDAAEEDGLFEPSEAKIMRMVVEFGDTVVREVMTPRVDMICIDRRATIRDLFKLAAEHKFSRFPVIEEIIDNVVGVAHIKSLLELSEQQYDTMAVSEIISSPSFVPETKRVSSLLRDFQRDKQQMAIVVDEYGGTAGLITLEDILEELVGDIEDEHEPKDEETEIVEEPDGSLTVLGHVDVDEVEEILGVSLDDEAYETVSGLALNQLKHIPVPGEKFNVRGVDIEILEADEKSILKLRIAKPEGDQAGENSA